MGTVKGASLKPQIRIGTSGWNYNHWAGLFYIDCPKAGWLECYTRTFSTVEVNATFYHLPKPGTVENWRIRTPEKFLWSVKASRYITHMKKLRDPEESLQRFYDVVENFGEKLGPILLQLPPSLVYREDVLDEFWAHVRKGHRYTIEPRNASWLEDSALEKLRSLNIALCIAQTAGRFPFREAVTADFVYVRLHGSQALYGSDYTEEELQEWAKKIRKWKRDTYVYFDNDANAYAPKNAKRLKEILKIKDMQGRPAAAL